MSYDPAAVESFGGLNLVEDPGAGGWSSAIDCLNVDFDQRGRIRSRDGYAKLTSAAAASRYSGVSPYYKTDGTKHLIAVRPLALEALNTSGGVVATQVLSASSSGTYNESVARFAAPGSEHAYVAAGGAGVDATDTTTVYRWDGAAWSTPAWTGTTPTGRHLAVSADNRLVNARRLGTSAGDNVSTVRFSDAGVPTTWGANNYVDISPGDGEEITTLVSWRELTFAFKNTKVAVFYGTSTDNSGNPIFNYRMVVGQGLATSTPPAYRAVTVSPQGIYFVNRRGIWLTTGGQPTLVSAAIDPIFRGNVSSFFASSALNQAQIALCALQWHDNRLYFAYPSGSATANDRLIVHDPGVGTWSIWDIPAADLDTFRASNAEELVFAYASGTNDIGRHSSTYTQDGGNGTSTGVAITSRYRSGFSDLGHSQMKTVREWILDGIGSPTLQTSHDFGSLEAGSAVTLGTSPATAENRRRFAVRGGNFSWQVGGTTAWTLNSLVANVREQRRAGVHSAA